MWEEIEYQQHLHALRELEKVFQLFEETSLKQRNTQAEQTFLQQNLQHLYSTLTSRTVQLNADIVRQNINKQGLFCLLLTFPPSFKGSSAKVACEIAATVNSVSFSKMGELFDDMVSRRIYFLDHSTCSSKYFSTRMDCFSFSTISNIAKSFESSVLVMFYWSANLFHFCSCVRCVTRE
jgi:hypothetical protein